MPDEPGEKHGQTRTETGAQFVVFTDTAIPVPPGTMQSRGRWQQFRVVVPGDLPEVAAIVDDLLQRVQAVVNSMPADQPNLDALRHAVAALPEAG